jgi:hypothetical protein
MYINVDRGYDKKYMFFFFQVQLSLTLPHNKPFNLGMWNVMDMDHKHTNKFCMLTSLHIGNYKLMIIHNFQGISDNSTILGMYTSGNYAQNGPLTL